MKIGLASSAVPLIQGDGRFIVDWLAPKLIEAGHQVETISLSEQRRSKPIHNRRYIILAVTT
jgi:hypothetical protein